MTINLFFIMKFKLKQLKQESHSNFDHKSPSLLPEGKVKAENQRVVKTRIFPAYLDHLFWKISYPLLYVNSFTILLDIKRHPIQRMSPLLKNFFISGLIKCTKTNIKDEILINAFSTSLFKVTLLGSHQSH